MVTRYSKSYTHVMSVDLVEVAARTDDAVARARAELVAAIRRAAAEGMTQAQIARQIGRSQPEVSRLLHFHGSTPLGRKVRAKAPEIRRIVADAGGSRVRVFGSVAAGRDHSDSDVDLLFTARRPLSLMELGRAEDQISRLLDVDVDLVPESALRPDLRDRVMAEAVAL